MDGFRTGIYCSTANVETDTFRFYTGDKHEGILVKLSAAIGRAFRFERMNAKNLH